MLALASLAITGCAKDVEATPDKEIKSTPGQTLLRLSAKDNTYSPAVLEASAGRKYRIEVSEITEEHTFSISAFDVNVLLSGPGTQSLDLDIPATARGDIPFFCSLHAGMGGTLRVVP